MADKIRNSLYKVTSMAWKVLLIRTIVVMLGNFALPGIIKTSNIVMGFIASAILIVAAFLLKDKGAIKKISDGLTKNKSIVCKVMNVITFIFALVAFFNFFVFLIRLFAPGFAPGVNSKPIVYAIIFGVLAAVWYFASGIIAKVDEKADSEVVYESKKEKKEEVVIEDIDDEDDEEETEVKKTSKPRRDIILGNGERRHVFTDDELADLLASAYEKGKKSRK